MVIGKSLVECESIVKIDSISCEHNGGLLVGEAGHRPRLVFFDTWRLPWWRSYLDLHTRQDRFVEITGKAQVGD